MQRPCERCPRPSSVFQLTSGSKNFLCASCTEFAITEGAMLSDKDPEFYLSQFDDRLSSSDVLSALAVPEVVTQFEGKHSLFRKWLQDDNGKVKSTLSQIEPQILDEIVGNKEFKFRITNDQFAYSKLWFNNGTCRGHACIACGELEHMPLSSSSNPKFRPHCALARSFAITLCARNMDDIEKEKAKNIAQDRERVPNRPHEFSHELKSVFEDAHNITMIPQFNSSHMNLELECPQNSNGTGFDGMPGESLARQSSLEYKHALQAERKYTYWLEHIRCFLLWNCETMYTWPGYMCSLLRESGIINHLSRILIQESMMEVTEHGAVYVSALRVVAVLNRNPSLRCLLTEVRDNGRPLASLVASLAKQFIILSKGIAQDGIELNDETQDLLQLIHDTDIEINQFVEQNTKVNLIPDENVNDELEIQIDEGQTRKIKYCNEMKKFQFAAVSDLVEKSTFKRKAREIHGSSTSTRSRRIVSEVSSLVAALPLSWSSTILVRVDEDRYDILQACIFGPTGTPYENGAFFFDIFLPSTYPEEPPRVHFLTTGKSTVRFGPNLYPNGHICLSLLGTWLGPSWTTDSTLLQLLVSLQSFIFVENPYFNEPGISSFKDEEVWCSVSDEYNFEVQYNTAVWAIRDVLRNPPYGFREAIKTHFFLKRNCIKATIRSWFRSIPNRRTGTVLFTSGLLNSQALASVAHGFSEGEQHSHLASSSGLNAGEQKLGKVNTSSRSSNKLFGNTSGNHPFDTQSVGYQKPEQAKQTELALEQLLESRASFIHPSSVDEKRFVLVHPNAAAHDHIAKGTNVNGPKQTTFVPPQTQSLNTDFEATVDTLKFQLPPRIHSRDKADGEISKDFRKETKPNSTRFPEASTSYEVFSDDNPSESVGNPKIRKMPPPRLQFSKREPSPPPPPQLKPGGSADEKRFILVGNIGGPLPDGPVKVDSQPPPSAFDSLIADFKPVLDNESVSSDDDTEISSSIENSEDDTSTNGKGLSPESLSQTMSTGNPLAQFQETFAPLPNQRVSKRFSRYTRNSLDNIIGDIVEELEKLN